MQTGTLRLQICSDSIVRVTDAPVATFPDGPSYVVTKTSWTMQSSEKDVTVATSRLKLTIARKDGTILFADATGKKLFQDHDRTLTAVEVNGEKTYHAELFSNLWDSTEAFYGLGQHQAGVWNYYGESVERQGKFRGMLDRRTFRIVFVGEGHRIGIESSAQADKTVDYAGHAITVAR